MVVKIHSVERDAKNRIDELVIEMYRDEDYYYYSVKRHEDNGKTGYI